jgi:antitoxin ParD1/3/4
MLMPTSVALDHHFEGFVRGQVESGRFHDASEVVRAGLRLLEESEQRRQTELNALRAKIDAGRASGPGKSAEAVFARLHAKYQAQADSPARGCA